MPLSERQKRYYVSAPAGEDQRETLSLWHPAFSQAWHLTNWGTGFSALVRGEAVAFLAHPFRVRLPERDGGRLDMAVDIAVSGPDFLREIHAAATDSTVRIEMEFNGYLPGDPAPQIAPYAAEVVGAALSGTNATLTAGVADWMNQTYPRLRFLRDLYPGLVR